MDALILLWQAAATLPDLIAIVVILALMGMFFNIVLRGKRAPAKE